MTPFLAAAAIFCLVFFASLPAVAQSDQDLSSASQCFPWQQLSDGRCVAKPSPSPPPAVLAPGLSELPTNPCIDDTRNLSARCPCPGNTHPDVTSGRCVADSIVPARRPDETIVCNGGAVTNGNCGCPAGFNLIPATGNPGGGTCVKTNAENCLGGELTVSGRCLCNGQVVMSGETYLLEYTSANACRRAARLRRFQETANASAHRPRRSSPRPRANPPCPRKAGRKPARRKPARRTPNVMALADTA